MASIPHITHWTNITEVNTILQHIRWKHVTREDAQKIVAQLTSCKKNMQAATRYFFNAVDLEDQAWAKESLPYVTKAIDKLSKEHNLGSPWKTPVAVSFTAGLIGIGVSYGLVPAASTVAAGAGLIGAIWLTGWAVHRYMNQPRQA